MRTSFLGYETGLRALQAHQLALETTGHNLANANVAGYSRQTIRMEATTPYAFSTMSKVYGPGMIGTGVQVTDIQAARDLFLNAQVCDETSTIGYWETHQDVLQEIEVILGEPQGTGLRSVIDQFWGAWQNVANDPSSSQYRQMLIQSGNELSDAFQTVYSQMTSLRENLQTTASSKIVAANAMFRQIADLNRQISSVVGAGDNPNDLMDTRNRLVEQLSQLMEVETRVDSRGIMDVTVAGHQAVSGFQYDELMVNPRPTTAAAGGSDPSTPHVELPAEQPMVIYWRNTTQFDDPTQPTAVVKADPLAALHGELGAGLEAANDVIQGYMNDIETMAQELVYHINEQHRAGYGSDGVTGRDFFADYASMGATTSCAASMKVVVTDEQQIAAAGVAPVPPATTPLASDGGNAKKITDLFNLTMVGDSVDGSGNPIGGTRLSDFFRGVIGRLGVATQESERMAENERALLTQVEKQRATATGVSTDEELVNMIKFQQGYNAAARLVTTIDEMVDTIINRMGLVGR